MKTNWLISFVALLFVASSVIAQAPVQRGKIITAASPATNPLDPNGDGFIYKIQVPPGFSNDGYYVDEFESKMFGIPKLGGDVNGDNQTGPNCGVTDLIPDTQGYSAYAFKDASNNLVFRFRIGDNANSIESWHVLIDADGLFGPGKDPNANADNPGFEIDITLIKKQNPGVFVTNIDGNDGCPNPYVKYPLATNFQIAVGDLVTCGDPDYFYDFFIPFSSVAGALNNTITSSTGLRYVATTSSSATCSMSGVISDIGGIDNDDPLYNHCDACAFTDLINAQCPTAVVDLCETCEGFNAGLPNAPTINQPLRAGQSVISGTSEVGTFIKVSIYVRNGGTDAAPTWSATPREEKVVAVLANGTWSVTLSGPLLAYDKVVAKAQLTVDGSGCDSNSNNTTSTSVTVVTPNAAPVAQPQTVDVIEDTPKAIVLVGTDSDVADVLTYAVLSNPIHGTLSCTNCANPTYTPALNYFGPDSFTFQVSDGAKLSNIATVTINVQAVNDIPVANNQTVTTNEDTPKVITLTATDVETTSLTYAIVAQPTNGTLSGTGATVTYTPNANFNGADSFTFVANDGTINSNIATVSITVVPVNDAPVASNLTITTPEDVAVVIGLIGTDVEGSSLTYTIVTPPAHGTLTGAGSSRTYTPAANYNGPDSFTYKVNDGTTDSNIATVTITVTPVSDPPVANNQNLTTPEDTALPITLTATDPDAGTVLTYSIVTPPQFGTLTGTAPNLTYTPNANYNGQDSFTFMANDGTTNSNIATIIITVTPVTDLPIASNLSITTNEDTPVSFTIAGSDPDGAAITYTIVSGPLNGTLSGTAPNLTYTPNANYNGPDSFIFNVSNGTSTSNNATVSITVTPVNDAPIALDQTVTVVEEVPTAITLVGADIEGSPLTYTIVSGPINGVLTGTGANLTYTSNDYSGTFLTDSFTFMVNDGTSNSNIATVFINILPDQDAPIAYDKAVVTNEDTPVSFRLSAEDKHLEPLTFVNISTPLHGTLSGTAPNLTYTPDPNYTGPDSFTFQAYDGTLYSNVATITITVNPINDAPVAFNQTVLYQLNTLVNFTLSAFDVEGSPLTYTILSLPANGTITGSAPNLSFTPNTGFNGTDNLTFKVNDGTVDSNIATVTFVLDNLVNDPPVAEDQTVIVIEDTNKNITLGASDPDGDALTYTIVSGPAHGTISGTGPNISYSPDANYNGPDSFTFSVNDGSLTSNTATVSITVTPVNDAPVTTTQIVTVQEDVAKVITLTATDVENSPLTFTILTQPTHGTLSGSGDTWTYTPDLNYVGPDEFEFRANDGSLNSNIGTITISVVPVNDAPVAVSNTNITTNEDVPVTFSVISNDTDIDGFVDGTTVDLDPSTPAEDKTFTVMGQGVYTVDNAGNVTFTPALNYNGLATAIDYTVKDNEGALSNVAQIQVNVLPVNDAPIAINQTVAVQEDIAKVIVLAGSDVENSPLTFTVLTQPVHGTLTGSGNTWTYTPNLDYIGPDSFTFKVSDGSLDSSPGTVSINVGSVNDPPVAVNDVITTQEDIAVTFNIINNSDSDPDGTVNPATVDLDPTTIAEEKTFTVTGQGTYTVDNAGNVTFTPDLNYNGTTTPISYTVKDNIGELSNVATIQVIVTPVNDAPVVTPITVTINEDEPTKICFTVTDVENDPSVFSGGVSLGGNGTITADPAGNPFCFIYTPDPDYNGTDQVQVTVCDANDPTVCSSGVITINILPVNDPPRIVKDGNSVDKVILTTPEDTPLNFCFDVLDPEGGIISVGNIANTSGEGTLVQGANGANELCFTYTPTPDFNGKTTWSITLCDDSNPALCGTFTIEINVTPVNDPAVATNVTTTTPEDTPVTIALAGTDVDGDVLTYTIVGNPAHGVISGSGANITYTPEPNYVGNDSFTYKVNDGTGDSNTATVNITVTPVNDAPIISSIPVITTPEDTPIDICIGVTDVEGDQVTYQTPVMVSGGGTMTPSSSFDFCFTFQPAKDFNGTAVWKFSVCDTGTPSKCTEVTVQINVTPVNDPPVAVDDMLIALSSTATAANILANDTDVDGDALTLTTTPLAGPFHGTVTMNANGSITYQSEFGFMGADSIRYKVCDNGTPSLCDEGVVFIEVGPAPFKIYNGFSPNGDGLNDYWRIDGIEAFPNNHVRVFDRYNNMIFEVNGYNNDENSWRGQTNHSLISGNLPEGTYFYSVNLGDGSDLFSGYVVLKKN